MEEITVTITVQIDGGEKTALRSLEMNGPQAILDKIQQISDSVVPALAYSALVDFKKLTAEDGGLGPGLRYQSE